jgi:hypothetical protein
MGNTLHNTDPITCLVELIADAGRDVCHQAAAQRQAWQLGQRGKSLYCIVLGREVDYSTPPSVEVENHEAIPALPIRLHGVVLNWLIN